ncbi:MAG: amidohydrolase family protein [Phycisphaera sp.]|nr:amidohydrolase family protein [Phycisphaera sp.]
MATTTINAANRFGLDYLAEARRLGPPAVPIVDAHTHINGTEAVDVFAEAMDAYGVESVWSMTGLEIVDAVRNRLGGRLEPIAVPDFRAKDRRHAHGEGYLDRIRAYRDSGARLAKFWSAPRIIDVGREAGDADMFRLDGPIRRQGMELAVELGMGIMIHIADPDTWFRTKYADSSIYGTKTAQYEPLEALLRDYQVPFMVAHMGGWPEDLDFLDGLLERHPHLHLDASATKWIVREISRHEPEDVRSFLEKRRGRILFGSDIVTLDEHLESADPDDENEMNRKAGNRAEAFDLYASRYWALRTLWETEYEGESPIADPDLAMVDPERHDAMSAPRLRGMSLPRELLVSFYRDAARDFAAMLPLA